MEINHLCAIKRQHSGTYLPVLPPSATWCQRFKRRFRTWTLVYSKHPKCIEFFKSATGLRIERKKHARSPYLYIIHPFSLFRIYYEMYMLAFYFIAMCIMFLDLNFDNNIGEAAVSYECISIFGLTDIIITFLTGYATEAREIVLEPKKIAKRYVRSMFLFFDIIAFIPVKFILWTFDEELRDDYETVLDIFRLVIIFRVYTLNLYMSNTAEYLGIKTKKIFAILNYTILVFVLVAFFGALNFHVPRFRSLRSESILNKHSWMRQRNLHQHSYSTRYMTMFARSTLLLLGASKGISDLVLWDEILLTNITFIFGRVYTILLTVLILHMMAQSRMLQAKYKRIMNQLEEYMTYKNLPTPMRKRLRMYYDYKYQKKFFREAVITSTLSDGLKREIKMHQCRKLVSTVTLFAGLSTQTVSDIIEYLKLEVYLPNDPIIKAGEPGDCMYFLSSGTVSINTPSGRELCHLQDGAYFGEIALIMKDTFRTANVVAAEICEVYSLGRKQFKKYFLSNPNLYQKMYQQAEDRFEMLVMIEEMYKKK